MTSFQLRNIWRNNKEQEQEGKFVFSRSVVLDFAVVFATIQCYATRDRRRFVTVNIRHFLILVVSLLWRYFCNVIINTKPDHYYLLRKKL